MEFAPTSLWHLLERTPGDLHPLTRPALAPRGARRAAPPCFLTGIARPQKRCAKNCIELTSGASEVLHPVGPTPPDDDRDRPPTKPTQRDERSRRCQEGPGAPRREP